MMAATIYDPETDSFVPVTSARGKVLAAQKAKPKNFYAAPAGGTDSQNAARLAAIPKPVTVTPAKSATGTVTATGTGTAKPVTPATQDKTKSPGKAWVWSGSSWTKPAMPDRNKTYTWDDDAGWKLKESSDGNKTVKSKTPKYDPTGKLLGYDIVYSDGTTGFESGPSATVKKFTWTNPTTKQVESFDSEAEMNAAVETWKVTAGQEATNAATEKAAADARAASLAGRTSAFD